MLFRSPLCGVLRTVTIRRASDRKVVLPWSSPVLSPWLPKAEPREGDRLVIYYPHAIDSKRVYVCRALMLLPLPRGALRVLGSVYRPLIARRRAAGTSGLLRAQRAAQLRLLGAERAARGRGGLVRVRVRVSY